MNRYRLEAEDDNSGEVRMFFVNASSSREAADDFRKRNGWDWNLRRIWESAGGGWRLVYAFKRHY